MDGSRHEVREQRVDATMASLPRQADEGFGHDGDQKVPASLACAGMAGVTRRVIGDVERHGLQGGEPTPNEGSGIHGFHFSSGM